MDANRRMKMLPFVLVPAAWLMAGCSGADSQRPAQRSWWDQGDSAAGPRAFPGAAPAAAREEPRPNPLLELLGLSDASGGAEDGRYTILLFVCRPPTGHAAQAKHYKEATEKDAGWKHLFVVHKEGHSLLCWGKYKTVRDAAPNLQKAHKYVTPASIKLYARAIVIPLPGKEDVGPPEWRLDQVPRTYVYTVLVAEFYDVPEADYVGRRDFAVDYCRQLRQQGLPAFYRHDPASSIVTVGAFERTAVQFVRKPGKRDPQLVQQEINDLLRSFPRLNSPANRKQRELRDKMVEDIRSRPNIERRVNDPRVHQLLRRFPCLAVNGRQKLVQVVNAKTGKLEHVPAPTSLIRIPHEDAPTTAPTVQAPRAGDHPGQPKPGQAAGDAAGPRQPAGPGPGAASPGRD
jgi:hypothetical protein